MVQCTRFEPALVLMCSKQSLNKRAMMDTTEVPGRTTRQFISTADLISTGGLHDASFSES